MRSLLADVTRRAARGRVDPDTWQRAVGTRIAQRTAPYAVRGRILHVDAATATWAQELTFLTDTIVTRLRALGVDVDGLRFRVKKIERSAALRRSRPRSAPVAPQDLPDDLARRVERIEDPELREAIASAAGRWLGQGSKPGR